ncbi:hypothetical protein NUW58_g8742 [Xylaria curta]|uniref:Uncharacterized protein n=1 Tax=Xylaria curta TaxID=42375 RepID=A0ACC1N5J6_9PEZI|nr:hypothetical protein NUW58_g8742 [Xylaria curta]
MGRQGKKRHVNDDDDTSGDEQVAQRSKRSKTKTAAQAHAGKDDEGNSFWPLSNTRRITIQHFKGKDYINIREYYDNNGDIRPGKKGIMLTLEQYDALIAAIPAVNAELQSKGHQVHDVLATAPITSASKPGAPSPPKEQKHRKMNIEATSDEEEAESG